MSEKRRSKIERNQEREDAIHQHELKMAESRMGPFQKKKSLKRDLWESNEPLKPGKVFLAVGWIVFALLIFAIVNALRASLKEEPKKENIEQTSSEY